MDVCYTDPDKNQRDQGEGGEWSEDQRCVLFLIAPNYGRKVWELYT